MNRTKNEIEPVLEKLEYMTQTPGYFTHFSHAAREEKIIRFEKKFGVSLPKSHKKFLQKFNGGMMLHDYQSEFLQTQSDFEMYKGDAVYLLSIEEITQKYAQLENQFWKVDRAVPHPYPIIPFCSLPNNELLVFVHGSKVGDESPVFDACHEEFPSTWGMVAPDFTYFLSMYLDAQGYPFTIGNEEEGVASQYFDEPKEKEEETPVQILQRTEKMLTENPDHAFAHYERANVFKDLGNLSDAYISISKAVELDGNDPFYHFIKGEILNEGGEYRAALISYDTAVHLNPDDTFYLCCRAGLLFQLNKLKPSIDDCNRAIELDSGCLLAYMIRKDIYELRGMEDKAEMDQMIIDKLEQQDD